MVFSATFGAHLYEHAQGGTVHVVGRAKIDGYLRCSDLLSSDFGKFAVNIEGKSATDGDSNMVVSVRQSPDIDSHHQTPFVSSQEYRPLP